MARVTAPAPGRPSDESSVDREHWRTAVTGAVATVRRVTSVLGPPPSIVTHDRRLELTVDAPPGSERAAVIAAGVTLHDLTVALAGLGVHGTVSRFPDPGRPEVLAQVLVEQWEPARSDDLGRFRALAFRDVAGAVGSATGPDDPLSPSALEDCSARWAVHVMPLSGHRDPTSTLLFWTRDDGRAAWLATGEALSETLIAARQDRLRHVRVCPVPVRGALAATLQREVDVAAVPQLLVAVDRPDSPR